ncbi:DUF599 domain-containing protein [Parasedimentitalea maritima]|uniref:DUF599 family protein n=1 Tax=Parasedimentitalea maritima TaxID=2578117 RepID=A0A6A4R8M5_9RHOB|nr:DUF599 domain-containing protein [Zongyanglinia marina]KAE9627970.1 DUF599 family protein [Zongyanglinia marina]
MSSFIAEVGWPDLIALLMLTASFATYGPLSSALLGGNISARMLVWRKMWARQMLWREERITDVSLVRGLIGNVSFFATTTVFVISGLLALIGSSSAIVNKLNSLPHLEPVTEETIILKLCALLTMAVVAFFKFGWAMRLHANALLMVGAAPEPAERNSTQAEYVSAHLAEMSALASSHFQGGVRAYYFGFASLPWLFSAWLLFPSLALMISVAIRREFYSNAFKAATAPGDQFQGAKHLAKSRCEEKEEHR